MFNDSDSFFYSPTGDLTNTLQRQFSGKYDAADPLWKRVRNFSINFVIVRKCIIIHTPECSIHVFLRTVGSKYCTVVIVIQNVLANYLILINPSLAFQIFLVICFFGLVNHAVSSFMGGNCQHKYFRIKILP